MSVAARLAELGLRLPEVAAPVAAYVPAVRSGKYVYTSGQLPVVDGERARCGGVSAIRRDGDIEINGEVEDRQVLRAELEQEQDQEGMP